MTPSEKITELKALLAEAKEALMNRDPQTREKECYDSGHVPCQCTLCKINAVLKPEVINITCGVEELVKLYDRNRAAYVSEICVCPSCSTEFEKETYQQVFCKTKLGTVCKDAYWNKVKPVRKKTESA